MSVERFMRSCVYNNKTHPVIDKNIYRKQADTPVASFKDVHTRYLPFGFT